MNMQVTDLLNKNSISVIEIHKQLVKELNPNKEIENVIEEGEEIVVAKRFSVKRKLNDLLKEANNSEKDGELLAYNKLSKATEELYRESFKEIQLN